PRQAGVARSANLKGPEQRSKIMTQEWARTRGVRQHRTSWMRPLWSPLRHFWPKRAIGTIILQTDFCGNELTSEILSEINAAFKPNPRSRRRKTGVPIDTT